MTELPKLEKFLLDADLDVEIQPYLEALGFRTQFALRIEADERDDVALLKWARENDHILVCHDKHKDKSTRIELFPELKANGGKILRVTGDSSQDILTALGKILVNREKWRSWFEENDGIVILKSDGVQYRTADALYKMVERDVGHANPAERILNRKPSPTSKRPLPSTPLNQRRMFESESEDSEKSNQSA